MDMKGKRVNLPLNQLSVQRLSGTDFQYCITICLFYSVCCL